MSQKGSDGFCDDTFARPRNDSFSLALVAEEL